jgi:hypothetical protein
MLGLTVEGVQVLGLASAGGEFGRDLRLPSYFGRCILTIVVGG